MIQKAILIYITQTLLNFNVSMESQEQIKSMILDIVQKYNGGKAVSYPVIDRKVMGYSPQYVLDGTLPQIVDDLVEKGMLRKVSASGYEFIKSE